MRNFFVGGERRSPPEVADDIHSLVWDTNDVDTVFTHKIEDDV